MQAISQSMAIHVFFFQCGFRKRESKQQSNTEVKQRQAEVTDHSYDLVIASTSDCEENHSSDHEHNIERGRGFN